MFQLNDEQETHYHISHRNDIMYNDTKFNSDGIQHIQYRTQYCFNMVNIILFELGACIHVGTYINKGTLHVLK